MTHQTSGVYTAKHSLGNSHLLHGAGGVEAFADGKLGLFAISRVNTQRRQKRTTAGLFGGAAPSHYGCGFSTHHNRRGRGHEPSSAKWRARSVAGYSDVTCLPHRPYAMGPHSS
jgi:hypothetical protein